jgi:hypothetical protein
VVTATAAGAVLSSVTSWLTAVPALPAASTTLAL